MSPKRLAAAFTIILIGVLLLAQNGAVPIVQGNVENAGGLAPVAVSDNGKYLVDADGNPFFWMADTAWDMHHRLTREEIELYLDDRQQKGINVILFRIPFRDLEGEPQRTNPYGDTPFVNQDITRPSEDFFQLVDFSLMEMERRGMTAGLLPLWGFVLGGKLGFNVSDDDVSIYAQWISNRYRDQKNIIWVSGGDTSQDPRWVTLGRELKTADPQKLVTFHPSRWADSSYHLFGDADWIDFHMTQTGHAPNLPTTYQTVNYVYNNSSKPILNGEPAYEDMLVMPAGQPHYKMPLPEVRKAIYWSLLAGGFAPTYGHVEIFQFAGAMPGQPYTYGADSYWMEALDAPGVIQISYLASLLRTVPWHTFVSQQSLIASNNPSGSSHIRASASADQTRSFIYFPAQQTATIRLSELVGPLNIRWFNPETGESQITGTMEASGTMQVTSPYVIDSLLILEPAGDPTPTPSPGPPTATEGAATATLTASSTPTSVPSCQPQPGELLSNGDFEYGSSSWHFHTDGSGSYAVTTPAYNCDLAARIRINVQGKVMQFFQYGVPLKANTDYRMTFAAYSASGRDLTVELLKHTSPYTNYGLTQRFDLSTNWQTYAIDFTTSGFNGTVGDGRLRFRLYGTNNDTYWIDAVSLMEVSSEPPTSTPPPTTTTAAPSPTPTHTPASTPNETATPTATAAAATATPTATGIPSCQPQPGELLTNGDFEEGSSSWRFYTDGSGSYAVSAPAYTCDLAARIHINVPGKVMQFYQYDVPLKANTAYRLTFAALSIIGNDLTADLIKHTSPYTNYGLSQRFDLSTDWQTYAVDFTTSGFSGIVDNGRLRFRLYGASNDSYWIDSVSLTEVSSEPPTSTPPPTATTEGPSPTPTNSPDVTPTATSVPSCQPQPGELLTNGDFEEGRGSWHFHTDGSGSFAVSSPAYNCDLAARIQINVQGKVMQFYQYGVPLKANTAYRLTLAAYSVSGNDLTAELLKHTSPYTNYGLTQRFDLGTGWQIYTVDFSTSGFSGAVNDGRLRFRLYGTNNDTYWIDSVSLQEIDPAPATNLPSALIQEWWRFLDSPQNIPDAIDQFSISTAEK